MIFIPCLGYFFISDILGGGNSDVIGNLIERQFQSGNNWPLGAALSIVLIVITLILVKQKTAGSPVLRSGLSVFISSHQRHCGKFHERHHLKALSELEGVYAGLVCGIV